jgi:hypothetical protein
MVRLPEGGAFRAGKEDGWQRLREQPVGLGLAKDEAQIIPGIAPRGATDGPVLRLEAGKVVRQQRCPGGGILAGGVQGALRRVGVAEGLREVLEGGLAVFDTGGGQGAPRVQRGEQVGKRHCQVNAKNCTSVQ